MRFGVVPLCANKESAIEREVIMSFDRQFLLSHFFWGGVVLVSLLPVQVAYAQTLGGLQTRIATEETTRASADTALGGRITDEASARTSADTALGGRITEETSARTSEDTALNGRIDDEETTRASADTALGGRIDTERDRITDLGRKVHKLEKDLSSGIALSLALQAPSVSQDKKVNLSLGAGYYNGETAAAFSFGVRVDENWSVNGGVGYGVDRKDFGTRAGLSFEF